MSFVGNFFNVQGTKAQIGWVVDDASLVSDTSGGLLVDSIPEPDPPAGQVVTGRFIDTSTKAITYTYGVPPLTVEDRLALAEQALNNIIMGS